MVVFKLTSGETYATQLISYNILKPINVLEVSIETNQGEVKYEIDSELNGIKAFEAMRDNIVKALDGDNCKIIEDDRHKVISFGDNKYVGRKLKSPFPPN